MNSDDGVFLVKIALLNKRGATSLWGSETALETLFLESSVERAIDASAAWAKHRLENLTELYDKIGCIKLYSYTLARPDADGMINSRIGWCLFEWKIDFPGTLDDWVRSAKTRAKVKI